MRITFFRVALSFFCLSLILACPLAIFASGSAVSSDAINDNITIWGYTYNSNELSYRLIVDIAGNKYVLIEPNDTGYFIYDPVSCQYLEGSADAPSPYIGLTGRLLYLGPKNYYRQVENTYEHTILGSDCTLSASEMSSLQASFNAALENIRTKQTSTIQPNVSTFSTDSSYSNMIAVDYSGYTNYYITNFSYITNARYHPNTDGTCGYVSASILLYYWHRCVGEIIPSNYLDGLYLITNGSSNDLHELLISYGNGGVSTAIEIANVLNAYINAHNLSALSRGRLFNTGTTSELQNNRPVIIFGSLQRPDTGGYVDHAVLAYGVHVPDDINDIDYIVHYGWAGYQQVILDGALITGVTQFQLTS